MTGPNLLALPHKLLVRDVVADLDGRAVRAHAVATCEALVGQGRLVHAGRDQQERLELLEDRQEVAERTADLLRVAGAAVGTCRPVHEHERRAHEADAGVLDRDAAVQQVPANKCHSHQTLGWHVRVPVCVGPIGLVGHEPLTQRPDLVARRRVLDAREEGRKVAGTRRGAEQDV